MTRRGVWDIQDVRDKLLSGDPWNRYNAIFTAGVNIYGQLGQNSQDGSGAGTKLAQVDSDANFSHVGGGNEFSMGTTEDGKLYAWGNNQGGILGLNQSAPVRRSSPVQVPGTTWASTCISDGKNIMATKTDGTAWFWGDTSYRMGSIAGLNSPTNYRSSPVLIGSGWSTNPSRGDKQKMIFTEKSGFAINTSGQMYSWGDNFTGNLGQNQSGPGENYAALVGPSDTTWQWVAGYEHSSTSNTAAIKTDGTLWMVGGDGAPNGCLGLGPYKPDGISSPTQIGTLTTWTSVSGGQCGSYGGGFAAMNAAGNIFVWGHTNYGTFGTNQYDVQFSSPYTLPGGPYKMAQICENTMIRMKADDTLWASGDLHTVGMVPETGHQFMSSPVQIPGTNVGFSSDNIGIYGKSTYLHMGVITPNLTPSQL